MPNAASVQTIGSMNILYYLTVMLEKKSMTNVKKKVGWAFDRRIFSVVTLKRHKMKNRVAIVTINDGNVKISGKQEFQF